QLPEVALLGAPVAVGVVERVEHLLLRLAVQARPLPAVAAGQLEGGAALLLSVDRALHACHGGLPYVSGRLRGVRAGSGGWGGRDGQRPSSFLTRFTSALLTGTMPARSRVSLLDLTSRRCRRPVCWRRSLPLPVILTRLAVPLCVLFLGMPSPFTMTPPFPGASMGCPARIRGRRQPCC